MRKRFTPAMIRSDGHVAEAKVATHGRIEIRDTSSRLLLRVTANGARSYITRPRFAGKPIRLTYDSPATVKSYTDAKAWADHVADLCAKGIDPREEARRKIEDADSRRFDSVVESFMKRHASKNRTADETQRIFDRYVLPEWRNRQITNINRRDVADLLDKIEDSKVKGPKGTKLGGPVQADRTLAAIRKLFNWYAARDDSFISPVVRGMARTRPKDRTRDRVLSDEEIRTMWLLLDGMGIFGALTKTLFLTAQRRGEVASMKRPEIGDVGVWTIPAERYKTGKPNLVPLSESARAVIEAQPVFKECDFVFTTTGENPFSGFSKAKRRLDELMIEAMREAIEESGGDVEKVELPDWRLHDLRRTAKTLMMRAGVRPDISERVLGHVIPGVEGVYDRHSYLDEKCDALEKLAAMIDQIVRGS